MELLFEKSMPGHGCDIFPTCDVPVTELPEALSRKAALPYPLGSCTMKYNPRINDEMAALPGFAAIHPLQPKKTVQGCLEALELLDKYLCEITGMDKMGFQPAAGAHGEFTGLLLIKKYHEAHGGAKPPNAPKLLCPTARTAPTPPARRWQALPR